MPLDAITYDALRDALWALRYGNPLRESPLPDLDLVAVRLLRGLCRELHQYDLEPNQLRQRTGSPYAARCL